MLSKQHQEAIIALLTKKSLCQDSGQKFSKQKCPKSQTKNKAFTILLLMWVYPTYF